MVDKVTEGAFLRNYRTGARIRLATESELQRSRDAAATDGGAGVITVGETSCYVEEPRVLDLRAEMAEMERRTLLPLGLPPALVTQKTLPALGPLRDASLEDAVPSDVLTEMRAYVAALEAHLAECYRLSGADPSGGTTGGTNEDWRLAHDAVRVVGVLRADYDQQGEELEDRGVDSVE